MSLYESIADELVNRILELIPKHPEILNLDNPWGLYEIDGFKCRDLQPTLFQASWALNRAKMLYNEIIKIEER